MIGQRDDVALQILIRARFSFIALVSRIWSMMACMKATTRPMETRLSRILWR